MHAVVITKPGGPEVLRWQQVPDPEPGPGEVLVDVAASAVNRADLMQRQGLYPPPPGAPPYPGLECAGTVIATGPDTQGWAAGDRVAALLSGGGYAERVAVPQGQLFRVPSSLSLAQAAALPEVICTVYSNVFQLAGLRHGELFLVHGGGSGIGTMAIQLAAMAGARVACTAGSAAKLEKCRQLGAEILINYKEQDFSEVLAEHGGADVILDIMGASYLRRNLTALAPNGRLAIIGFQGGRKAELDLSLLARYRASVSATTLRARPASEKAGIVRDVSENIWPMAEDGRITAVIGAEFAMPEAGRAHQLLADGGSTGKIVLLAPNRLES